MREGIYGLKACQRGQAMAEFIILFTVLVLLTLGTLQMALLYRDKATMNDAVFRAAREGSLRHAFKNQMNLKLVEALTPLYVKDNPSYPSYLAAQATALVENMINPRTGAPLTSLPGVRLDIISPNKAVFDAFSDNMYSLRDGCESRVRNNGNRNPSTRCSEERYRQIPNDNLNIRSTALKTVNVGGTNVQLNLQDANLLKVKGYWCAPLVVPLVNRLLYKVLNNDDEDADVRRWVVNANPMLRACQRKTQINSVLSNLGRSWRTYYIPVTSDSVVRMQSPVRCEGDERNGRNCRNLN
jgi:hypothetical protein